MKHPNRFINDRLQNDGWKFDGITVTTPDGIDVFQQSGYGSGHMILDMERVAHGDLRRYKQFYVDKELKDSWLDALSGLTNLNLSSICVGHGDDTGHVILNILDPIAYLGKISSGEVKGYAKNSVVTKVFHQVGGVYISLSISVNPGNLERQMKSIIRYVKSIDHILNN